MRTAEGLAALRAIAETQLSPAGQLQVATALDMVTALDGHLDAVRRLLLEAARHLTAGRAQPAVMSGRVDVWVIMDTTRYLGIRC